MKLTKSQILTNLQTNIASSLFSPSRKAAVLVPLVETSEGVSVLFEVRASHLNWQPGDICFPGGKIDKQDTSPKEAALRETQEELGITQQDIQIYTQLPAFSTALGLEIHPFIGEIMHLDNITINQHEVANIFTVPIDWFINNPPQQAKMLVATKPDSNFPVNILPHRHLHWQERSSHQVYIYYYKEYVIWGLTAQILQASLTIMSQRS